MGIKNKFSKNPSRKRALLLPTYRGQQRLPVRHCMGDFKGAIPKVFARQKLWPTFLRSTLIIYALAQNRETDAGTDYWTFNVNEKDGKLIANVNPSTTYGTVTGYSYGEGTGAVTTPTMGTPIDGNTIYDMFWNRLDYLLGLKTERLDCRDGLSKIKKNETWRGLDNICDSVTLNTHYPENLSDPEIERIFKDRYLEKWGYMKKYHHALWKEQKKKDSMLP